MQDKNKTVMKSMSILTLFIDYPRLTFNELMDKTNIPKTSLHRMLGSLEEMGFLTKNPYGHYELGLLFLQFGQLVADRLDVRGLALPIMQALRDEVEEAVNLIVRDGDQAMYIEKIEAVHPVRLYTSIGRKSPLYAGACSRIILSFLSSEEQQRYIEITDLQPIGIGTITDKEKLNEELHKARLNGYTISHSELEDYTTAVSAPIFNHKGEIAAGISVAGIDAHFNEERMPFLIKKVTAAASEISAKLGYIPQHTSPFAQ